MLLDTMKCGPFICRSFFELILFSENLPKPRSSALYELDGKYVKSNHDSAPKMGGPYWSNTGPPKRILKRKLVHAHTYWLCVDL